MSAQTPGSMVIKTGFEALLPKGFMVGHAQDDQAGTGCTVILCEQGATGAVSVRGAAPATTETDLLDPRNTVEKVNGILLSGGSAFGLEAVSGVMQWLSQKGVGFSVLTARVPIVCGASIFDLTVGSDSVYPNKAMGYMACENATTKVPTGNVGAGTGASIGKLLGESLAMKAGLGFSSMQIDDLIVSAVVVVNAVGNVFDRAKGAYIAGIRDPHASSGIIDPYTAFEMISSAGRQEGLIGANTTIGCIITNGSLTKAQATHVADMAHDGYARALEPVHTGFDGDAVFVLSSCQAAASVDLIGVLAARVIEASIHHAACSAVSAYGLPGCQG